MLDRQVDVWVKAARDIDLRIPRWVRGDLWEIRI